MKDMFKKVPIAIVGMGGIFPGADHIEKFRQNIIDGLDMAREVPEGRWIANAETMFDSIPKPDKAYSLKACFVDDFVLDLNGLDLKPDLVRQLDPLYHFALHAGRDAFFDCRSEILDKNRINVILAAIALPTDSSSKLTRSILGKAFESHLSGKTSHDIITPEDCLAAKVTSYPASLLAKALGLGGSCYTLDAACASSLYAVKLACDELQSFRVDAVLAGGVSRPECLYTQVGFSQLRALSPSGRCAPFDKDGDGLVVGEGAGIVMLKRLEDAVKQGDRIYGIIKGIGLSNDMSANLLAPDSEGQLRAMRKAYESAHWMPSDVDYIECHGAGTRVGDAIELASLKTLWENVKEPTPGQCALGSVKSNIGHLLTAAGAAGLIKTVLGMHYKFLPPSANFKEASEASPLKDGSFRAQTGAVLWEKRDSETPRRAAVSAFGFGGINAHLLLEEYDEGIRHNAARSGKVKPFLAGKGPLFVEDRVKAPRIAVIGMAVCFSTCKTLRQFQELIFKGNTIIDKRPENRWKGADETAKQISGFEQLNGSFLENVAIEKGEFRIPPNEIADILPQQLLMLKVSAEALTDAGYALKEKRPDMGAVLGIAFDYEATNFHLRWNLSNRIEEYKRMVGITLDKKQTQQWLQSLKNAMGPPLTAVRTQGALGGIVASRIAKEFGFGGPSFTVSQEEASGIRALEIAVRALQRFEMNSALVGAVDLAGDVRNVIIKHHLKPWSNTEEIFSFDHRAESSLPGEGAAALVMKRLDDALADGNRIYAVIDGLGSTCKSISDDSAASAYVRSLDASFFDAGIDADSVSYFEAMGTGNVSDDLTEAEALNLYFKKRPRHDACALGSLLPNIGHTGAVCGLAAVVKTCLCLYHELIPPLRNYIKPSYSHWKNDVFHIPAHGQFWARNRKDGPRRACAGVMTCDDTFFHVVLESVEDSKNKGISTNFSKPISLDRKRPSGLKEAGLFCVTADDKNMLFYRLQALKEFASKKDLNHDYLFEHKAFRWFQTRGLNKKHRLAVSLIAQNAFELDQCIQEALNAVNNDLKKEFNGRNRVAYAPEPLGHSATIAFIFPGSGNHFLGMGREIGIQWPEIYRHLESLTDELKTQLIPHVYMPWRISWEPGWEEQAIEYMESNVLDMIFGQVVHGGVMANLIRSFGVKPSSVIGYSLGESAGLFALGGWPDQGGMLYRMQHTDLFSNQLAGPCKAARKAWKISDHEPFEWLVAVVNRPADLVKNAMVNVSYVRLLIVNTPDECVIGGRKEAVEETIRKLGCEAFFLKGVVTVHCDAALPAAEAYKKLHLFPTMPLDNIRFYSCANGCAYDIDSEKAADSILKQALFGFDFPRTIHQAYKDGVRIFLEMGPHASCTRMIRTILKDRRHLAISASMRGEDEHLTVLKCLGSLVAERVAVDMEKLYGTGAYPSDMNLLPSVSTENTLRIAVGGSPPCPVIPEIQAKQSELISKPEYQELRTHTAALFSKNNVYFHDPFSDMMEEMTKSTKATAEAHRQFLDFSAESGRAYSEAFGLQNRLLESLIQSGEPFANSTMNDPDAGLNAPLCQEHETNAFPIPEQRLKSESITPIPAYSRDMCMEFAIGSLARVLGPEFAEVDTYRARVRLPDEPLMLVDRILTVEGKKGSLTSGKVVTEHDVLENAWYLDGGRAPVCISVEAGQADLFLCSYLGIDLKVKGERTYRLLDAVVEFSRGLPQPGETIRYHIKIEKFVRQGNTYLFFFHFDGYIGEEHLITMTDGCAGFFTEAEIENSGGIVLKKEEARITPGKTPENYYPFAGFPTGVESYNEQQLDVLRKGDLAGCFGTRFEGLALSESLRLPGGKMKLIHRVLELDPEGGRYQLGFIKAQADISPDDWFLTCHFMDDMVMPGTLMYECCAHTLRVLLQRMGWVTDKSGACYEPVSGVKSRLKCRGPVTPKTRHVIYEVFLKEIGFSPEPYAVADALMYADGRCIVSFKDMSMKMSGVSKDDIERVWKQKTEEPQQEKDGLKQIIYDRDKILAFAVGKPSEAFGKLYEVFDNDRKIARLPGPPYSFMDRVVHVEPEPWVLKPGGWIESEYDIPPEAWYFRANRTPSIAFCVLLEIALQPCGWLAAYAGSALKSSNDLKFRNLGGCATLHDQVFPENGPLTMKSRMVKVSEAADMIIEYFDFEVIQNKRTVYEGDTYFGFFTPEALKQQVGIREAGKITWTPTKNELKRPVSEKLPTESPIDPDDPETASSALLSLPSKALLMIDSIDMFIPDGGPNELGFVRGIKEVDPEEWFFKAHFYQDPVCPGSLGIESFLQLLKFAALKHWPHLKETCRFEILTGKTHCWTYRGQIIPTNKLVEVEAVITQLQEKPFPLITANGCLKVDGLVIYQMKDFGIQLSGGL
ncbi:MAG: beta-ketoacyl synthase N-terminal-like domain-containing protein [Desulfobacterales bacterium]